MFSRRSEKITFQRNRGIIWRAANPGQRFSAVFCSQVGRGFPRAQLLAPVILGDDRGKAFLELLKKKNDQTELVYSEYEPGFTEVTRELIDDPLFTKRNDELSPEDFAKMVRRDAFHTIQACHFNFAEYNVGGPDLNAVKFEFDEMRALVSFQCRLGNL